MEKNEYELVDMTSSEDKSTSNSVMGLDNLDNLLAQADKADRAIVALKKVMEASLKITTANDWVLIGGTPYLQETGASKVAKLFGVSWEIVSQETTVDKDGYKAFHYRVRFYDKSTSIEAEGSRSAKDDFFAKTKTGMKSPDEIDLGDVKRSAFTNCINTGIKRMIPGLRGITKDVLVDAGIDTNKIKGYDFNTGTPKEISKESQSLKDEIKRMLSEASNGDEAVMKKLLLKHTSFEKPDGTTFRGYEDADRITEKSLPIAHSKVKKAYDEWLSKQQASSKGEEE